MDGAERGVLRLRLRVRRMRARPGDYRRTAFLRIIPTSVLARVGRPRLLLAPVGGPTTASLFIAERCVCACNGGRCRGCDGHVGDGRRLLVRIRSPVEQEAQPRRPDRLAAVGGKVPSKGHERPGVARGDHLHDHAADRRGEAAAPAALRPARHGQDLHHPRLRAQDVRQELQLDGPRAQRLG